MKKFWIVWRVIAYLSYLSGLIATWSGHLENAILLLVLGIWSQNEALWEARQQ